jgi:Zn-finger nucleic acid-binding protein
MSVLIRIMKFCPVCNSDKLENFEKSFDNLIIQHCISCSAEWFVKGEFLIKTDLF